MSGLENPSDPKSSILGQNHCRDARKRATGSLSLLMDKSSQEDCEEGTKLKIRPENRDAWTKVAKRVVTNEQN